MDAEESLKDEGDGWVSTPAEREQAGVAHDIPSIGSGPGRPGRSQASPATEDNDDDDIPDIDDLALEEQEADEVGLEPYEPTSTVLVFHVAALPG